MSRLSSTLARGVAVTVSVLLALHAGLCAQDQDGGTVVGRVRVTEVGQEKRARFQEVMEALEASLAAAPGQPFADKRLISLRPRPDDPGLFDATIYDYSVQRGFNVVVDGLGNERSREALLMQPAVSPSELEDAEAIVSRHSIWAGAIAGGSHQVYPPMPPVTVDDEGRRLVNVGVQSLPAGTRRLLENEVVSVDIPAGKVIRYPFGAPETSSSSLLVCNPPASSGCLASVGSCAYYHVEWPAANPVWKFNVRHPSCTRSVQTDGTGLELTDVYYKNTLILQRAETPVLNVLYQNNTCGPFRDWLFTEDCFQATGTDVPAAGSGIRVTTGNPPPKTICESGNDTGNFKGVAIHDLGNSLWLVTEMQAGWYRYVMEWRLHMDGEIEPIFGFGATSNGCTCSLHYHHAYWRIEWAIGGVSADPATGINTLERRRAGTLDQYDPVTMEGKFYRTENDQWRIRNPQTGTEYLVQPGTGDGSASGDTYAKGDYWALADNSGEINDLNSSGDTRIAVDSWVNDEGIGANKRLVLWYHIAHTHGSSNGDEACVLEGPKLLPVPNCYGTPSFDRSAFRCSDNVSIQLGDSDLAGAGTATATLSSATETSPETVTLTESPPGSGKFGGSILAFAGPAVNGDGRISVSNGDTLTLRYVDASYCETPNVTVTRSVPVDCVSPALSDARVIPISTVSWITNEPATSVAHYGTSPPGDSAVSDPTLVTSHRVVLPGLTECSSYSYWIESSDAAGNTAASPGGGGSYTFTTGRTTAYASADTPMPIPNQDPAGVTSSVSVPENKIVEDVDVTVNITHTADSDLHLSLITPSGTRIPLASGLGGMGDNFTGTVFDDEAATPISAGSPPFSGSFRPENPLGAADGANARGAWSLEAIDYGPQDLGTLDSWTLRLNESCPPMSVPPPVPDGSFGSGMTAVRADPGGSAIQLSWDVAACPAQDYHVLYGPLASVSTYSISGSVCALGTSGHYAWSGAPSGCLWFVLVADNGTGVEGSWGWDSSGAHRGGSAASGKCGIVSRVNTESCP